MTPTLDVPMTPTLDVANLSCRRGQTTVLDQVRLQLSPGDRHAVIGPNGAGKTTLLHLVAGLLRPSHGHVMWNGKDITRLSPQARARAGIARTFQHAIVVPELSVLGNVILGAWPHTRHRWRGKGLREMTATARESLERVGLSCADHVPAGTLSHGQRRLLDLATALACRPRLILLDEPTAGLSVQETAHLADALRQLPDDIAVLIVEHHMDVVTTVATTTTALSDGTVRASGPTHAVLADVGEPPGGGH